MLIYKLTFVFVALALLGVGCGKGSETSTAQPSEPETSADAGVEQNADGGEGEIPEGWEVYKGTSFDVPYPPDWHARSETLTDPIPPDLVRVVFEVQPIPEGERETEPVFMVMLEAGKGTIEARIARYAPLLTRTTLRIGQREVTRFTYEDGFMGGTPVVYVFEEDGRVYLLLRADGDDTDLETMIQNLEVL